MPKKILIAPNAFKHSLSAIEVAEAIYSVLKLKDKNLACEMVPIADGGDGTIDVLHYYIQKSKFVNCNVYNPLMKKIKSKWLLLNKNTAVIELAKSSGINLLKDNELNPLVTNTYGSGELIKAALDKGCRSLVISLGGSATVDGGLGILYALGVKLLDKNSNELKPCGAALSQLKKIDLAGIDKRIYKCKIYALCDVRNILVGSKGTINFSKQKGANYKQRIILEKGMNNFAKIVLHMTGKDYSKCSMVGAAGGVAFMLKSFLNAELLSGFSYLAKTINLKNKIKKSNIIITGEGKLDSQTFMGKGVYELIKLTRLIDVNKKKIIVLCGESEKGINWKNYTIDLVLKLRSSKQPLNESIKNAKKLLRNLIEKHYNLIIES